MITVEQFQDRAKALYKNQQTMAAAKKWKSGKRAGTIRRPAVPLEFDCHDLARWLWKRIGLNACPCPYCGKPIDILSLTLDHVVPRSAGGRMCLDNMEPMCQDCNHRKGELSAHGFAALLRFLKEALAPYDQNVMMKRLKAAHHGAQQRFFRDKRPKTRGRFVAAAAEGEVFELPPF